MSRDHLDDVIRDSFPAADIDPQRVDRIMAGVMARIEPHPAPSALERISALFTMPGWVGRYAVPMGVAAVLGLIIGNQLGPVPQPQVQLSSLVTGVSTSYLGY